MTDASEFFEWLDEQEEPAEREAPGWMCDTIEKAEAAARRLRDATDRIAAIDAVADRMVADANAWRQQASAPFAGKVEACTRDIETFLRVQIADGGPKSTPLPYGVSVSARKTGGTLVFDPEFVDAAPDDVVRVKRSIDAAKAKAYYTVAGDGIVVDPNGEVVDGVTVAPVVDAVKVTA
jgi:hypothetical protein